MKRTRRLQVGLRGFGPRGDRQSDGGVIVVRVEAEQVEGLVGRRTLGRGRRNSGPGRFRHGGIEGKIEAIRFARLHRLSRSSAFALECKCAVVGCARDLLGLENANSTEFEQTTDHPVIWLMEEQESVRPPRGFDAARLYCLASWPRAAWRLRPGRPRSDQRSGAATVTSSITLTASGFQDQGLVATGISPDGTIVEIMERRDRSLVRGGPVPPRVQIETDQGASAVSRFH